MVQAEFPEIVVCSRANFATWHVGLFSRPSRIPMKSEIHSFSSLTRPLPELTWITSLCGHCCTYRWAVLQSLSFTGSNPCDKSLPDTSLCSKLQLSLTHVHGYRGFGCHKSSLLILVLFHKSIHLICPRVFRSI